MKPTDKNLQYDPATDTTTILHPGINWRAWISLVIIEIWLLWIGRDVPLQGQRRMVFIAVASALVATGILMIFYGAKNKGKPLLVLSPQGFNEVGYIQMSWHDLGRIERWRGRRSSGIDLYDKQNKLITTLLSGQTRAIGLKKCSELLHSYHDKYRNS